MGPDRDPRPIAPAGRDQAESSNPTIWNPCSLVRLLQKERCSGQDNATWFPEAIARVGGHL
eukprot:3335861-Rhodomonas_salina.1